MYVVSAWRVGPLYRRDCVFSIFRQSYPVVFWSGRPSVLVRVFQRHHRPAASVCTRYVANPLFRGTVCRQPCDARPRARRVFWVFALVRFPLLRPSLRGRHAITPLHGERHASCRRVQRIPFTFYALSRVLRNMRENLHARSTSTENWLIREYCCSIGRNKSGLRPKQTSRTWTYMSILQIYRLDMKKKNKIILFHRVFIVTNSSAVRWVSEILDDRACIVIGQTVRMTMIRNEK